MTLARRIKLYLIGILIGGLGAYAIFGDRLVNSAWTPEEKVKQRLRSTLLQASPSAEKALHSRSWDLGDVRKAMGSADIDFGETVRSGDSIYYAVEAEVRGEEVNMVIVGLRDFDTDSTATLWSLGPRGVE